MTGAGDDDSPGPDRIVIALSSIALGALTGGLVMTAGTLAVRSVVPGLAAPESTGFIVLSVSVVLGFGSTVLIAFAASRPVSDLWQRAVIGAIAFFGAAFLSVLAAPIDMWSGPTGLLGWMAILLAGWVWAFRSRRHAG